MHSTATRPLCGLMSSVLLFTWCGLPFAQAAPQNPSPDEVDVQKLEALADQLESWLRSLEQDRRDWPRDTFDPKAVLEKVGREPEKLLEWVRDNTSLVPYRGSLRGPRGVLMDRVGNSLDRALLLCELLRLAGHQARLARAELTEQQVAELLQAARPAPLRNAVGGPDESIAEELLERGARLYRIDREELRKGLLESQQRIQQRAEQMARRLEEQMPAIVAAAGTAPADAAERARTSAIDALREHWWVQWRQGAAWNDADPSLPPARPAGSLAQAAATLRPSALGPELLHTVELRVVVERWDAGRLEQRPVLSHELRPSRLEGQHVQLVHVPLDWPQGLDPFAEPDDAALQVTALAQTQWLPVLLIGKKQVFEASVSEHGTIDGTPSVGEGVTAGKVGSALEGLGGALDSLPTGATRKNTSKQAVSEDTGVLTAAWLEYEIRAPGRPARTFRRDLFDLLGPAARAAGSPAALELTEAQRLERSLALLGTTEILVLGGRLSPEFVQDHVAGHLLARRQGMLSLLRRGRTMSPDTLSQKIAEIQPLPAALYALAQGRVAWNRSSARIYLDRPNVLSYRWRLRAGEQGSLLAREGIDIVANEVAVLPAADVDPYRARLEQGLLDTSAEILIGQMERPASSVENTAELHARSRTEGIEWLTVRALDDPAWQQVELSADVRARIAQDLEQGYMALVPSKEVPVEGRKLSGWWRIDPASGDLLGRIGTGEGAEMVEYVLKVALVAIVHIRTQKSCEGSSPSGAKRQACATCAAITTSLLLVGLIGISPWTPGALGAGYCAEAGLMN